MPKKLSEKAALEATNSMLVDDMNFLLQAVAIADVFMPLDRVAKEAAESGMHTPEHAKEIAGRVAGYLMEAVKNRRQDMRQSESKIDLPRILLPN